jgi:thiamine-monophosphate kinase
MRESELLKHIYAANRSLPSRVTIPPGDDMGAVRIGDQQVLITVDQIEDGVHFQWTTTPVEKVARKAVTRNLSDVAAMAAKPVCAVVAVCLPRGFGEAQAERLFDLIRSVGDSYGCPVVGGDIAVWDHPLAISVTLLAEPAGITPVRRDTARVGDWVCVTGCLGGSLETIDGSTHHLDFEPRLSVARKIAGDPAIGLHSMIDLSDGLGVDLARVCRASAVGAELWADQLPVSAGAKLVSLRDGLPPWRHALADGEDYELCLTVSSDTRCPDRIDGVPITRVGMIIARDADAPADQIIKLNLPDGSIVFPGQWGWEHRG